MNWQNVESILRATYLALEDSDIVTGENVNVVMGRDANDATPVVP